MRRRTGARRAMIAFAAAVMAFTATPASAEDTFRFEGSGWGHAVGMSQYGALAMAKAGWDHPQILKHYFTGTRLEDRDFGRWILVGLLQERNRVTFRPTGGSVDVIHTVNGSQKVALAKPGEAWEVRVSSKDTCTLSGPGWSTAGDCQIVVRDHGGGDDPKVGVTVDEKPGRAYARGRFEVKPDDADSFHVVAALPDLESYLYGLAEVPYSWPPAALRAQAVAGRSYAMNSGYRAGACACHVYDDVRSQVYYGTSRESGSWSNWKAAVDATHLDVLIYDTSYGEKVATAFYSSSSGGRTENVEDYWSTPLPYLRSVDDRWSLTADNPRAYWTIPVPESALRSKLALDDVRSVEVLERYVSGSVKTIAFHGTQKGNAVTVTKDGHWLRNSSGLGLYSRFVRQVFLPPFIDDDGSPHEADIAFIADRGVTKGCNPPANDQYCPTADVTREQMAAFLVRALGLTRTSGKRFADVPADSTFATDIDKLATAGITKGCNPPRNDRFCPGSKVTREQMAAFMSRGWDLTATSGKRFSDVRSDSPFVTDIDRLATAGLTRGCNPPDNTRFCPRDPVTREQMASFLARALRDL